MLDYKLIKRNHGYGIDKPNNIQGGSLVLSCLSTFHDRWVKLIKKKKKLKYIFINQLELPLIASKDLM